MSSHAWNMPLAALLLAASLLAAPHAARAQSLDLQLAETYYQYVPALADLGLGLVGVKSENPLGDRAIELAVAYTTQIILVNALLKNVVNEERPDGSAFNSFPSGHTATAFTGAELVRLEYGWGWGAGAYALATTVGVMRVVHQRHHWWDALAGAGIGILCANVGRWSLKPIKGLFGAGTQADLAVAPTVDPYSGTPCAALALRF